jgi:hypothetical protein
MFQFIGFAKADEDPTDILACNKFSSETREFLRIGENEKTYAHIQPHSRSVKGPSCGTGLAPGTQPPHEPPPLRAVNNSDVGVLVGRVHQRQGYFFKRGAGPGHLSPWG